MSYPTFEEYHILYRKYREGRPIKELIDLAGDLTGRHVVDLCCGNGEVGLECRKRGAETVVLVDRSLDMLPLSVSLPGGVNMIHHDIASLALTHIDVVFCRQGVNYWFNEETAALMAKMIKSGGVFVFNTFNTKPEKGMKVKEYFYKKANYVEVNYMKGDVICHTQICDAPELVQGSHYTEFRWIPPKKFEELLSPYFHIERNTYTTHDGYDEHETTTDIYRCIRNSIEYIID